MSTVFYRWGAGKDESRVTFDGTHISVFDFKREIILNNRMGNGKDFDLGVFDNVTGEEIKDDNHPIPRSSSLVVRRMPASQGKNRGTAQTYIAGTLAADALGNEHRIEASAKQALLDKQNRRAGIPGGSGGGGGGGFGSLSKRFDGKGDEAIGNSAGIGSGGAPVISTGNEEEDRRIAAFFEQSGDQWEKTQEDMSLAPGRQQQFRNRAQASRPGGPSSGPGGPSGGGGGSGAGGKFDYSLPPDREPPQGYICYRCGQKGHWIQNCPIGDDPSASDRKRFNRVTGIPRSFLKTVQAPDTGEGSSGGAMLTADGGFVMAMPDQRQWQKQQAIKRRTQADLADLPYPPELSCPLDRRLFADAVKVPCCGTTYCEECITTHLVEHDFECPACESKVASLKRLKRDEEVRARVAEWKEENEGGGGDGDGDGEGEGEREGQGGGEDGIERGKGEEERKPGKDERDRTVDPAAAPTEVADGGAEEEDVKPDISGGDAEAREGSGAAGAGMEHGAGEAIADETQSEPEEGAASPTKPSGPSGHLPAGPASDRARQTGHSRSTGNSNSNSNGNGNGAEADAEAEEAPKPSAVSLLDPQKMQEMLDPQVMQIYLTQIQKMLLNPIIKPDARALLIAQRQLVQSTVMQMQMAGMGPPNPNAQNRQGGPGQQHMQQHQQHQQQQQMQQMQHGGMGGMMMPDMNMNMGMGMGMMGQMGNANGNGNGNGNGMGGMPSQMQQMQQMQQMEQMMMMNMGNMGGMANMANMGGMGDMMQNMQNMQGMQGQGMGGMNGAAAQMQNGNGNANGNAQQGGNFGPGARGGRGGFQRGGGAGGMQGFRGRGRGRGGMGMGAGMGFGPGQGQGQGQHMGMGVKREMGDGFEGGPEGKMARIG